MGFDKSSHLVAKLCNISLVREEYDISRPRSSSLYESCMRMHVLAKRYGLKKTDSLSIQNRITFGIGDAVHYWAQNTGILFDNNRYGFWACPSCHSSLGFGKAGRKKCRNCRYEGPGIYEEAQIATDPPYVCGGHPDLFISVSDRLRVVELKTIAVDNFKSLAAPLIQHTWQIQYYMWACYLDIDITAFFDPSCGYVVYIAKQEVRSQFPVKIFKVKRDPLVLSHIKAKLRSYSMAVAHKHLPAPESKCLDSDFSTYKARNCPCLGKCKEAV